MRWADEVKRFIADTLKRTARLCLRLAYRLNGPKVTFYDAKWNKLPEQSERIVFEQGDVRWSGMR